MSNLYNREMAEAMAPAFVSGLEAVRCPLDEVPVLGYAMTQPAIRDALEEIDFSKVDIRPMKGLVPEEYVTRIMAFAYGDASQLLMKVSDLWPQLDPDNEHDIGLALFNSKKSLLKVSQLSDSKKDALFFAMTDNELAAKTMDTPAYEGIPMQLGFDRFGNTRIEWTTVLAEWVVDGLDPSEGCPADDVIVEVEGKKQTLTHFFWNKLITAMYPLPVEE